MPSPTRRRVLAALVPLALAAAAPARAEPDAASLCRDTAGAAERALGLPPGLLLAVGRVESGRDDAASQDVLPWPWSVNDEGEDHVFGSAFDAIAYVVAAQARGSRSIDVGCFQVNLLYHPEAFATLSEAFDPAANARAAGQFLADLHARADSWQRAVELYHSATPWRGAAYRELVLARWHEATLASPRLLAAPAAPVLPAPRRAASVRVHYPGAAPTHGGGLPRVIVPSAYAAR